MQILFILFLVISLPVAWFASEFSDRRGLRITLGFASVAMSFLVAFGVGKLEHLNANAWYGSASKALIDTTITELESDNVDDVVRELKSLQKQFEPTYETRARYDVLVEDYVSRLRRVQPVQ